MSFAELAELVRAGKVTERSLVARAGTMNWEPAWHVPGLFRAAGIVEPGDSPPVEGPGFGVQGSATDVKATAPAAITPARPAIGITEVVRGLIAIAVGLLAVGFFYRWAAQATMAFPMPPTTVEGELIDCYFPAVGRCTALECGLLYVDVFAVAAVAAWYAVGKRVGSG